jgi:ABC-type multidrug transport system ATPase subunit
MKGSAVHIEGLQKSYKNVLALQNISVDIKPGELFGFIGPDGAGKTTLFRILASLILPEKGVVQLMGFDVVQHYKEIRHRIGYMPGRFSLYQDLTVEENLRFFAGVHGTTIEQNYALIKDIYSQIEPFKNRPAGKLSGGMKQKLALSCALIHKPEVLLLDEPTTGVDAVSRQEFWLMLQNLKKSGITILVSTPYMDEASLCDRVALIQKGEIMKVAEPEVIINDFGYSLLGIKTNKMFPLLNDLIDFKHTKTAYRFGDTIHFVSSKEFDSKSDLISWLESKGHENIKIQPVAPTIEDCFILQMKQQN